MGGVLGNNHSLVTLSTKHCDARGGCDCDCSWASGSTCGNDDGSCCFGCCCGSPGPSPPSPPTPGGGATYCPNPASDFTADYGSPQWSDSGWTIHGGARASSRASYNLAGGFVEFDMDLGGAHGGVNNNFYITFPSSVGNGLAGYLEAVVETVTWVHPRSVSPTSKSKER